MYHLKFTNILIILRSTPMSCMVLAVPPIGWSIRGQVELVALVLAMRERLETTLREVSLVARTWNVS